MSKKRKRKLKWSRIICLCSLILLTIIAVCLILIKKPKDNNSLISNNKVKENSTNKEVIKEMPKAKAPLNNQEFVKLSDGEYETTTGHTLTIKDGVAYVEGNIIVNKTYNVDESYIPQNPYSGKVEGEKCNNCINKEVMDAFNLMKADATSIGLNIYIASGYRSYTYQQKLYNNYVGISGTTGADTYSARAGYSEHQTGTCFDLNSVDDSFAETNEGKWVNENAASYGFIIRYPKNKSNLTGYKYESWHLRYVGKELAQNLYKENGEWITLEEYYGLTSSYE